MNTEIPFPTITLTGSSEQGAHETKRVLRLWTPVDTKALPPASPGWRTKWPLMIYPITEAGVNRASFYVLAATFDSLPDSALDTFKKHGGGQKNKYDPDITDLTGTHDVIEQRVWSPSGQLKRILADACQIYNLRLLKHLLEKQASSSSHPGRRTDEFGHGIGSVVESGLDASAAVNQYCKLRVSAMELEWYSIDHRFEDSISVMINPWERFAIEALTRRP